MDKSLVIEKLKKISLFKKLPEEFFEAFYLDLKIEKHVAKDVIMREGEAGREMYFLLEGTVRINKKTKSGDEYTVTLLKDDFNVFFGEMGLLSEDKRSATIISEEPTITAKINSTDFQRFIMKHPQYGVEVLLALSVSLSQKIKKSNEDIIILYEALMGEIGTTGLGLTISV